MPALQYEARVTRQNEGMVTCGVRTLSMRSSSIEDIDESIFPVCVILSTTNIPAALLLVLVLTKQGGLCARFQVSETRESQQTSRIG